ncbi:MAG TPA: UDP-glucuronic acid decarboxylase family protein [Spirochaetota bacterium]|nr:UDP-glucuronic acid decarboxylase family protein [Spirochaetota bacterium]
MDERGAPAGSGRRVLVAGGAGFIGSHLCDALVAAGNTVLCVDNFHTGAKRNIERLLDHDAFELHHHDIVHPLYFAADQVYNLACPASPVHYQSNPVKTIKTNVIGTINLLGLARRVMARILQASTSEVYGDPESHPQSESYWGRVNPIGPRACYDEGKRCAEALCVEYHRQNAVDIRIARIFNTYGPRMHPGDGRVVSNFIVGALRGEALTVYGDGTQSRSFCYVDDMVKGLVALMNHGERFTGPVNLGNPEEISIGELAALIVELAGSRSRLEYRPLPEDDPVRRRPDISRAERIIGWRPSMMLEDGLKKTIDYFDELLSNNS